MTHKTLCLVEYKHTPFHGFSLRSLFIWHGISCLGLALFRSLWLVPRHRPSFVDCGVCYWFQNPVLEDLTLSRHAQGGPLLLLKSLFISRNWIFHAVIKICRSSLPWHRLLLIWERSDQIRLCCSSLSWDLKDEGWHFPPFCKLMPLICLTRTKLDFKIPNDKEIKTLNGFPKGNLYCKAPSRLLNFQLEFLIGYWLKWMKCCQWLLSRWQRLLLTFWDITSCSTDCAGRWVMIIITIIDLPL